MSNTPSDKPQSAAALREARAQHRRALLETRLSLISVGAFLFVFAAIAIFLLPPSADELAQRLCGRGTEAEHVRKARLDKALEELGHAGEFHYRVVNDDAQRAAEEIHAIVTSVKSAPHSAAVKE